MAITTVNGAYADPNTNLGKQLVKEVRGDTYLTKEYSDKTGETKLGLPEWIPDDNGNYKPYIIMENNDAYVIENKYLPMGINKSNCMTTFYLNNENILDGADTLIENQYWEVYHKENETDNYQLLDTSSWDCDTSFNTSSKQFSIFTTWDKSHGDIPLAQSQYDTTSTNSTGTFYFRTLSETTNNPTISEQTVTNSTGTFTQQIWTDNITTTTENIPVIPDELISTFEVEYRYMLETGEVESFTRITNNDANMENHYFQFVNKFDGVNYEQFNLGDDIEFTDASYIGSYYATAENVPDKYIQIAKEGYPLYYSLEKGEEWWTGAGATIYMDGAEKKLNVQVDFGKDRTPLALNTMQELDPTLEITAQTKFTLQNVKNGDATCSTTIYGTGTGEVGSSQMLLDKEPQSDSNGNCRPVFMDFDISSIPSTSIVTGATFEVDVDGDSNADADCVLVNLPTQASVSQQSLTEALQIDTISSASNFCSSTGDDKEITINSDGITDIQDNVTNQDFYSMGIWFENNDRHGSDRYGTKTMSDPSLSITYSLATVTAPPTNLAGADVSTSAINLSWTAPSTASATIPAVTGYRIQSSDFAFANTTLPTGRASDTDTYGALTGGVDMANANLYLGMNGTTTQSVTLDPISDSVYRSQVSQTQSQSSCVTNANGGGDDGISNTGTDDNISLPHNNTPWGVCSIPSLEFSISSIPDSATITGITLNYDVDSNTQSDTIDIVKMGTQPSTVGSTGVGGTTQQRTDAVALWDAIFHADNTDYATAQSGSVANGKTATLGGTAVADLEANLSEDWFAVSLQLNQGVGLGGSSRNVELSDITLEVTYDNLLGVYDESYRGNHATTIPAQASTVITDDFSDGQGDWQVSGSGGTATFTGGEISSASSSASENKIIYLDLGTVSETGWILRWTQEWTTVPNNYGTPFMTLSSTTGDQGATQNYIAQRFDGGSIGLEGKYSATLAGGTTHVSSPSYTSGTWYHELIRDGSNAIARTYTDSTYTTITNSATRAISNGSGDMDLQYIKFVPRWNSGTGTYATTIDDVKFYNGVTEIPFDISKDTDLNFEGTNSAVFDGSNDYMTLPSTNTIIPTTGAFTLGTWIKPDILNSTSTYKQTIFSYPSSEGSVDFNIEGNDLEFRSGDANNDPIIARTHGMNSGSWNNVAVSRDGSNNFEIFVNGTRLGAVASNSTSLNAKTSGATYFIGVNSVTNDITNKANIVNYWKFDSDSSDTATTGNGYPSGTGKDGSDTSITLDTSDKQVGSGSYDFNGSTSRVTFGTNSDWIFLHDGSEWSTTFWAKVDSLSGGGDVIGTMAGNGANEQGMHFGIHPDGLANIYVQMFAGNGAPFEINSGGAITGVWQTGSWNHYAVTFDEPTLTVYRDGVSLGTITSSGTLGSGSPTYTLHMGDCGGTCGEFDGHIDDFAIWNTELSSSFINTLYQADATDNVKETVTSNFFNGKMDEMYVLSTQSDTVIDNISSRGENSWTDVSYNTGGTGTTYSHTGISGGSGTYVAYRVSAHNSVGLSGFDLAEESTASTPSAPQNLSIASTSPTILTLDWDAPASQGGSSISAYKVYRGSSSGFTLDSGSLITTITDTSVTEYANTGLTADTRYYYSVLATNTQGDGTKADADAYTLLNAPTSLTATGASVSQINLAWTAPTGANNLDGYKIEYNNGSWQTLVADTGSTGTTYSHTSLSTGNSFTYRVSGLFGSLAGLTSNTAQGSTYAVPSAITDLSGVGLTGSSLRLSWSAPSSTPALTGYMIEQSDDNFSTSTTLTSDTGDTNTTYDVSSGVSENTDYYFRVKAINSIGTASASNIPTVQTGASQSGGGGGGGGGSTSFLPQFDELVSLSVFGNAHKLTLGESVQDTLRLEWNSAEDLQVNEIIVGDNPFRFAVQKPPFIVLGDNDKLSNAEISYTIQVPNNYCTMDITVQCVEPDFYEVPVNIKVLSEGRTINKNVVITVDLSSGFDPALFVILLVAGIASFGMYTVATRGSKKKNGSVRKTVNSKPKSRKNGSVRKALDL